MIMAWKIPQSPAGMPAKGIETFCMTVNKSGHDYLKRMCPDERYMIIEEMEDLPSQLTKVYAALTGK